MGRVEAGVSMTDMNNGCTVYIYYLGPGGPGGGWCEHGRYEQRMYCIYLGSRGPSGGWCEDGRNEQRMNWIYLGSGGPNGGWFEHGRYEQRMYWIFLGSGGPSGGWCEHGCCGLCHGPARPGVPGPWPQQPQAQPTCLR